MRNIESLISDINSGIYDDRFKEIYVDTNLLDYQKNRYISTLKKFEKTFSVADVEIYSAPGRTEICGNHTDHQHGMVLASSINLDTIAVVEKTSDSIVKILSEGYDMIKLNTKDLEPNDNDAGTTTSLIKGVLKKLNFNGHTIGGFNAYITSDVLVGAGLSSSASFEVIVGTIVSGIYNDMKISPVEIAQVSQYAENVYFKKPCGLMDQMACSVGGIINIDFENPDKPILKQIDTQFEKYDYSLCIVDTKGDHADLTDDYASIPTEMSKVAKFFGKTFLRDCSEKEFYNNISTMRKEFGDRPVLRTYHFFEEEKNVADAVSYLEKNNFEGFLNTIKKSGNSSFKFLQNIYTTKDVNNQNMSVALAFSEKFLADNGVCRVHGGGFAGTIQAFVKNSFVETYKKLIENIFGEGSCHILKIRDHGGIKVV